MQVVNALVPDAKQLEAFFGAPEDGPIVMVNLLKFREKAQYEDGSNPDMSGAEAYMIYGAAVQARIAAVGGRSLTGGIVTGLMLGEVEQLWDMVALVEYPSVAAFQAMLVDPEYQAITVHRNAGLEGQLNIKIKPVDAAP